MGQEKRKVFSFDENDLEWINPLIVEWVKENEGKKRGDLLVQLLREFKLQRDGILEEDESQPEVVTPIKKEKQDYFGHVREVLNINFDELESRAQRLQDELQNRYEELKGNVGKSSRVLSNSFNKFQSRVRSLFSRLREGARDARVEELEAELERLQTMTNELKAKLDEQEEDEEEDRFDEDAAIAAEMEEIISQAQAPS